MEFFYLHDWNVVEVADGFDFGLVLAAQRRALQIDNGQPTAIVYRTVKGWRYGIEGKKCHGGGHKLCSDEYVEALVPCWATTWTDCLPLCDPQDATSTVEACLWETLELVRALLEREPDLTGPMAARLDEAPPGRLDRRGRTPRAGAPDLEAIFAAADPDDRSRGPEAPDRHSVALRQQLGKVLGYLNEASGGAIAPGRRRPARLDRHLDGAEGFPTGYFHYRDNPGSRTLSAWAASARTGSAASCPGCPAFGGTSARGRPTGPSWPARSHPCPRARHRQPDAARGQPGSLSPVDPAYAATPA